MKNSSVQDNLNKCRSELDHVILTQKHLQFGSPTVRYLIGYSIIRACGTIEQAYKSIIADFCCWRSKQQVKSMFGSSWRKKTPNPRYSSICRVLNDIHPQWKQDFKTEVDNHKDNLQIISSLDSLVNVRNDFAHGGSPTASLQDIKQYFDDSRKAIVILDDIVSR